MLVTGLILVKNIRTSYNLYSNHNRIPNILTNRMVISLRVYDSDGPPADTPTPDSSSGVDFTWNPWLGNIGFSLDADEQDDERGGDYFK